MQYPGSDIKPHQHHRAGSSTLVDKSRAAVIGQVAPRSFIIRALTHGQPRANTPGALKGLIGTASLLVHFPLQS